MGNFTKYLKEQLSQESIFETVAELKGLSPADMFEIVDLSSLNESQIQEKLFTPCFARNKSNYKSLSESNVGDQAEDSLHKNLEELIPNDEPLTDDEVEAGVVPGFKLKNAKVKAVVFSMSSAYTCAADAKGLCLSSEACYAKRDEAVYPAVGSARNKQEIYWKETTAQQFVDDFMKTVTPVLGSMYGTKKDLDIYKSHITSPINTNVIGKRKMNSYNTAQQNAIKNWDSNIALDTRKQAKKDIKYGITTSPEDIEKTRRLIDRGAIRSVITPIKYFRFNESGDFGSQEDIEKMSEIAKLLNEKLGIITYGYTARNDLSFGSVSFRVKGSGYPNLTKNGHVIVFPERESVPKGYLGCLAVEKGASCLVSCNVCATTNKNVAFRQHSNLGAIVDKVVTDRYRLVYSDDKKLAENIILIKNTEDDRLFLTKNSKWTKLIKFIKQYGKIIRIVNHMKVMNDALIFNSIDDANSFIDENGLTDVTKLDLKDFTKQEDTVKKARVLQKTANYVPKPKEPKPPKPKK